MIVDSSALLAVAFREPGYERILAALGEAGPVAIGASTLAETGIVLGARLGPEARAVLASLVQSLDLSVVPFRALHAQEAREAYLRFGRGRHEAGLNFGDCLTYAVAKLAGEPLLFMGEDFARTDLERMLA
ncbi:MAG: type II toxin-antitoxin system VapC family toxin [Thermoanaerobaculia bacterium]|nr:type II toxin-antitoxin system VapC family toxin [Thermoanaerobaculia bacterium]